MFVPFVLFCLFVCPGLSVTVCWQFEECRVETLSGSCTDRQRALLLTARAARLAQRCSRRSSGGSDRQTAASLRSLRCSAQTEWCCLPALVWNPQRGEREILSGRKAATRPGLLRGSRVNAASKRVRAAVSARWFYASLYVEVSKLSDEVCWQHGSLRSRVFIVTPRW